MANKKPAIPTVSSLPQELTRILQPMKENIDLLTGVQTGGVRQLDPNASLSDVVAKINEVIARLNQAGQ